MSVLSPGESTQPWRPSPPNQRNSELCCGGTGVLWCLDMCAASPVSGLSWEGCRPCLAADLCSASLLPRVGGARYFLCRGGGPGCEGSCVVLPSVADRGIGLAPQARLGSRTDRDARLSTKGSRVCLPHTWGDSEEAGATSSPGCQGSLTWMASTRRPHTVPSTSPLPRSPVTTLSPGICGALSSHILSPPA